MMLSEYARYAKVARIWGETDQHYHRRVASFVKRERTKNDVKDLDAYVLSRMYDYVGHVIRMGSRYPGFLPCIALRHRDKSWCLQHQEVLGHQGHHGRFNP